MFDNRSEAHLRLQEAVYRLADSAGWGADIESVGPRRRWIADVLLTPPWCDRSTPYAGRIAVEIQLSPQAPENYIHRTRRYGEDGVWTLWLTGLGATPHFETGYARGSVVGRVVERGDDTFLTPLNEATWIERPLGDLIGLLDGTIRQRSRHRIPTATGLALPPGHPPGARPSSTSARSPGRLAPKRPTVVPGNANIACRTPHQQAPGWYRVMFTEHLCSNCGLRPRSWRALTCGESGHRCNHAPTADPEGLELAMWTITTAIRESLTADQAWPCSSFARPSDAVNTWECSCGHSLAPGREVTWQTVGVQMLRPSQPGLF